MRYPLLPSTMLLLLCACEPPFEAYLANENAPMRTRSTSSWDSYGGPGATKYAALEGITKTNVGELRIAWTYRTGDTARVFQNTPILVNGQLVVCSPHNVVIALDPLTGGELWRFDPGIRAGRYGNEINCRGVAQWHGGDRGHCAARILLATNDARLIALSADTGKKCENFGASGEVNLQRGVGSLRWPGEYQVVSPPAVVANVVVVGSAISDNQRIDAPSGVVRGFDARTGALVWAFDLAPPDFDRGRHPVSDAGYALATPNVWTSLTVDEARDMVFLPTGNPAPDYFRSGRPDMDYYGSALVALRGSTGEYLWHFNTVINDFWDFDVPSAPSLLDLTIDGKRVPALVQSTKMGFVFVLNRLTGEPLIDVEYREVPRFGPLASQLSPVQPFPPDAFRLSRSYVPGGSWLELVGDCGDGNVSGPVYTPITEKWTIGLPSNMGATNWGGVAVDPERGLVAVRTNHVAYRTRLIAREDAEPFFNNGELADEDGFRARFDLPDDAEIGMQRGTAYLMARHMSPCAGLPAGELVVLSIPQQRQLWRRPHGGTRDIIGLDFSVGLPGVGGPLVTASGLIFVGGVAERAIRAYDLDTGDLLWHHRLPFPGNATPMSYQVTDEHEKRKQMVIIAAGGDARSPFGGVGDYLVAFALPGS